MRELKVLSVIFSVSIILLFLVACSEGEPVPQEGRIYYSVIEKGVSRIEYMDQYGEKIHYVVGDMADEYTEASYSCVREYRKFKEQDEKNGFSASYPSVSANGTLMAYIYNNSSLRVIDVRDRSEKDFIEAKTDVRDRSEKDFTEAKTDVRNRSAKNLIEAKGEASKREIFYLPRLSSKAVPQLAYLSRDEKDNYNIFIKESIGSGEPVSYLRSKLLSSICWSNFNNDLYLNYQSPDGYVLYSMNADKPGKRVKKVIGDLHDCAMSPRGSVLAAISKDGNLMTYDIYTKRTMTLVREGGCSSPTWSPQGNAIAFIRDNKIFKVSTQGGQPEQLSHTNALIKSVCWAVGL